MYTDRARIVGLSGIDTVALVEQLMKAESFRYVNMKKQQQILIWQQEKYRAVTSSLQTFRSTFTDILSPTNLRSASSFGSFKATLTTAGLIGVENNKATVRTTGDAKEGNYTLQVGQLATKASVSSEASFGSTIIGKDGFDATKLQEGDKISFTLNGVSRSVTVTEAMTQSNAQFDIGLKSALESVFGKTADPTFFSVSSTSGRLEIGVKKGNDLVIFDTARTLNTSVTGSIEWGNNTFKQMIEDGTLSNITLPAQWDDTDDDNYDPDHKLSYSFSIGGEPLTIELGANDKLSDAVKKINDAIAANDETKNLNIKASASGGKLVFANSSASAAREVNLSGLVDVFGTPNSTQTLKNTSVLSDIGITSQSGTFNVTGRTMGDLYGDALFGTENTKVIEINNGKTITISRTESLTSVINRINGANAGVNVSYDPIAGTFKMEAKTEGALGGFTSVTSDMTEIFGFQDGNINEAKNAVFRFNGVETERESNSFAMLGLNITLVSKTDNYVFDDDTKNVDAAGNQIVWGTGEKEAAIAGAETINVSVKKDSSATMQLIKDFVAAYNDLIAKINGEVSATRPRSGKYSYYEPLTDEEKKAMSEREIDLWEEKAKEGLLSRDSTLSGITQAMREALRTNVIIEDGKKLNLFHIGVTTSPNYWEGGKLVIDENKLAAALDEYGDDIAKLFTKTENKAYNPKDKRPHLQETIGLGERLDNILNNAIGSYGSLTEKAGSEGFPMSLSTNYMYKRIMEQENRLADMLDQLARKEEQYYAMFSRMEAAVVQANNQMAFLMQQMGF